MTEIMAMLTAPFTVRVAISFLCGAIVGIERQLRGKPVGIRTSVLICLGTMAYIHLGQEVAGDKDMTRVLGQVVTGVGFLGAGVIMNKDGVVNGITSAAVVWLVAAIGAAIGFGYYGEAIALSIIDVLILTGTELLEKFVSFFQRGIYRHSSKNRE